MKRNKTIILAILAIFIVLQGCSKKLLLEHEEAMNVEIKDIDFRTLRSGEYNGYYEGGMYQWRENECKVLVDSQKVTIIELVSSTAQYTQEFIDTLYGRVINQQTLQVDAVSGATLDSKACLKAIENALIKAGK